MTATPNTVSELLSLNESKSDKWDELSTVLEDFSPVETIELVHMLTHKLNTFHWEVIKNKGEDLNSEEQTLWVHDATILSQVLAIMSNLTDLNDPE